LVDRIPVAANAQMTALQVAAVRGLGFVAGALLRTTSMLMACVSRALFQGAAASQFLRCRMHPEQLPFGCRPTNAGGAGESSGLDQVPC
jgi:hypothetical protein